MKTEMETLEPTTEFYLAKCSDTVRAGNRTIDILVANFQNGTELSHSYYSSEFHSIAREMLLELNYIAGLGSIPARTYSNVMEMLEPEKIEPLEPTGTGTWNSVFYLEHVTILARAIYNIILKYNIQPTRTRAMETIEYRMLENLVTLAETDTIYGIDTECSVSLYGSIWKTEMELEIE